MVSSSYMGSLRTSEGKKKYDEYRREHANDTECSLCTKLPLKSFKFWKIVENSFPYDLVAKEHHMMVPVRHVTEDDLTYDEQKEFRSIKNTFVNESYDYILESTNRTKTIPSHFHLHLIITVTNR